jgi:hypothetical protein
MFFFAIAVLVRDLRPLALPYCSKDRRIMEKQNEANRELVYAKVKLNAGNLYKTLLNRSLCTCIVLQRSIGKQLFDNVSVPGALTHRRFTQSSFT